MENLAYFPEPDMEPVSCLPASELWGRQVRGRDGESLGTIDSIVHTLGGPMRAIVRTGQREHRFVLVDISRAALEGDVVVVQS
jgi:hypothetical protein